MNQAIKPPIVRWMHIIFAIPILGYIYSRFEKLAVVSGLWMWKGHLLRGLVAKRSAT